MRLNRAFSFLSVLALMFAAGFVPTVVHAQKIKLTNTSIQVQRPNDNAKPWGTSLTIHNRNVLRLRWKTTDANVSKGVWQLSDELLAFGTNHPPSKILADGEVPNTPADEYKEFNIDLAQYPFIPQSPPTAPRVFWIRLVPYNSANQFTGTISGSVKITYVKATTDITSIVESPHGTYAELTFKSKTAAIPVVEVSTSAPSANYTFQPGQVISTVFPFLGGYQTNHGVRLSNLQPSTTYHYVIRTKDENNAEARKKGTFTTLRRRLRVRFEKIFIKDDSDDLSEGDFGFGFTVNGQRFLVATFGQDTGETRHLTAGNFDVNLTNPASPLVISVLGVDNDEAEVLPVGPFLAVLFDSCGSLSTGGGCDGDAAEGSQAFEYATGPDEVFNQSFTIKSQPAKMKFEVTGTISVTYN